MLGGGSRYSEQMRLIFVSNAGSWQWSHDPTRCGRSSASLRIRPISEALTAEAALAIPGSTSDALY